MQKALGRERGMTTSLLYFSSMISAPTFAIVARDTRSCSSVIFLTEAVSPSRSLAAVRPDCAAPCGAAQVEFCHDRS